MSRRGTDSPVEADDQQQLPFSRTKFRPRPRSRLLSRFLLAPGGADILARHRQKSSDSSSHPSLDSPPSIPAVPVEAAPSDFRRIARSRPRGNSLLNRLRKFRPLASSSSSSSSSDRSQTDRSPTVDAESRSPPPQSFFDMCRARFEKKKKEESRSRSPPGDQPPKVVKSDVQPSSSSSSHSSKAQFPEASVLGLDVIPTGLVPSRVAYYDQFQSICRAHANGFRAWLRDKYGEGEDEGEGGGGGGGSGSGEEEEGETERAPRVEEEESHKVEYVMKCASEQLEFLVKNRRDEELSSVVGVNAVGNLLREDVCPPPSLTEVQEIITVLTSSPKKEGGSNRDLELSDELQRSQSSFDAVVDDLKTMSSEVEPFLNILAIVESERRFQDQAFEDEEEEEEEGEVAEEEEEGEIRISAVENQPTGKDVALSSVSLRNAIEMVELAVRGPQSRCSNEGSIPSSTSLFLGLAQKLESALRVRERSEVDPDVIWAQQREEREGEEGATSEISPLCPIYADFDEFGNDWEEPRKEEEETEVKSGENGDLSDDAFRDEEEEEEEGELIEVEGKKGDDSGVDYEKELSQFASLHAGIVDKDLDLLRAELEENYGVRVVFRGRERLDGLGKRGSQEVIRVYPHLYTSSDEALDDWVCSTNPSEPMAIPSLCSWIDGTDLFCRRCGETLEEWDVLEPLNLCSSCHEIVSQQMVLISDNLGIGDEIQEFERETDLPTLYGPAVFGRMNLLHAIAQVRVEKEKDPQELHRWSQLEDSIRSWKRLVAMYRMFLNDDAIPGTRRIVMASARNIVVSAVSKRGLGVGARAARFCADSLSQSYNVPSFEGSRAIGGEVSALSHKGIPKNQSNFAGNDFLLFDFEREAGQKYEDEDTKRRRLKKKNVRFPIRHGLENVHLVKINGTLYGGRVYLGPDWYIRGTFVKKEVSSTTKTEGESTSSFRLVPDGMCIIAHPHGRIGTVMVGDYEHGTQVGSWYLFEARNRQLKELYFHNGELKVISRALYVPAEIARALPVRFPEHSLREGDIQLFQDGEAYFEALQDALEKAEHFVYITGWSIDERIQFSRDCVLSSYLKGLLDRKKKAGKEIQIVILLWPDVKLPFLGDAMGTGNRSALVTLKRSCPSIVVVPVRRPRLCQAHHQKSVVCDSPDSPSGVKAFLGGIDLSTGRYDNPTHCLTGRLCRAFEGEHERYNPGYDKKKRRIKKRTKQNTYPRLAWHDIHASVVGAPALDVLENFRQRWILQGLESFRKSSRRKQRFFRLVATEKLLHELPKRESEAPGREIEVSIHRSIDNHAIPFFGLGATERGAQNAWIRAVRSAKQFVYIEQQFLCGGLNYWDQGSLEKWDENAHPLGVGDDFDPFLTERTKFSNDNTIPLHIVQQIVDKRIRVIVIMPPWSAENPKGAIIRVVLECQLKTISMMYAILSKSLPQDIDPKDHLRFFCLGNVGHLYDPEDEEVMAGQIYVHSKMMIVDDQQIIVDSANLNIRSMSGKVDTEIGIRVRTFWRTCGIIRDFRRSLFKEHYGSDYSNEGESEEGWIELVLKDFVARSKENWELYTNGLDSEALVRFIGGEEDGGREEVDSKSPSHLLPPPFRVVINRGDSRRIPVKLTRPEFDYMIEVKQSGEARPKKLRWKSPLFFLGRKLLRVLM